MLTARLELLGLKAGDRVLDLGCGEGRHVHGLYMLGDFEITGVDLDEPSLEKARAGLQTIPMTPGTRTHPVTFETGDATALRFADHTFDVVICSEVLEHLPDYGAALAEIRRVLKPEGRLCVSVPHAWPERICWRLAPPPDGYAFEPGGHIRIFDKTELRIAVERHGFRQTRTHKAHAIHVPYWWLKCAFWDRREDHPWIKAYHRLLVWDIMQKPFLTRALDRLLSPLMGKSLVAYFEGDRQT